MSTETVEIKGPVIVIDRETESWYVIGGDGMKVAGCGWMRTEASPERVVFVDMLGEELTVAEARAVRDMFTLVLGEETEEQQP